MYLDALRTRMPLMILAISTPLGALAVDEPAETLRDPWAGFQNGAWITFREKGTFGEQSAEMIKKHTLVSFSRGTSEVTEQRQTDNKFGPPRSRGWHVPGRLPTKEQQVAIKDESFTVGRETFPCVVVEYVVDGDKAPPTAKIVFWRCKDIKLPYRELKCAGPDLALMPDVVRVKYEYSSSAKPPEHKSVRAEFQVVSTHDELTIGERKINCVLEQGSLIEETASIKTIAQSQRWLSDEVPGRVVKHHGTAKVVNKIDSTTHDLEVTWELLDFGLSSPRTPSRAYLGSPR